MATKKAPAKKAPAKKKKAVAKKKAAPRKVAKAAAEDRGQRFLALTLYVTSPHALKIDDLLHHEKLFGVTREQLEYWQHKDQWTLERKNALEQWKDQIIASVGSAMTKEHQQILGQLRTIADRLFAGLMPQECIYTAGPMVMGMDGKPKHICLHCRKPEGAPEHQDPYSEMNTIEQLNALEKIINLRLKMEQALVGFTAGLPPPPLQPQMTPAEEGERPQIIDVSDVKKIAQGVLRAHMTRKREENETS